MTVRQWRAALPYKDSNTGLLHGYIRWPEGRPPTPYGCRWCGIERRGHGLQHLWGRPSHRWEPPTQAQIKARMVERMSTKVALTGPQAMRVAGRMAKLGKPLADLSAKTAAAVQRGASLIRHPSHAATRAHFAANPLPQQERRRTA